ncbi:MAG: leucine-rich repeat domain-containing protein [Aureispira sp.]
MKPLLLVIGALCVGTNVMNAQSVKMNQTKSTFIEYPKIPLDGNSQQDLQVSFYSEDVMVGNKQMKEVETTCVPKGGSLKDVITLKTFYYQIDYTNPNSIVKISNTAGKTVYMEQVATSGPAIYKYGHKQCEHFVSTQLKKNYEKDKAGLNGTINNEAKNQNFEIAKRFINNAAFFVTAEDVVKIASAKGGGHDYTALDAAQKGAIEAFKVIKKKGMSDLTKGLLEQSIATWTKELEELDLDDKKARINKRISLHLYQNIAWAQMYLLNFEEARQAIQDAIKLTNSNVTSNATEARQALKDLIYERSRAYEWNKDMAVDLNRTNLNIDRRPSNEYNAAQSELAGFEGVGMIEQAKAEEEDTYDPTENPYLSQIQYTTTQGHMLTVPQTAMTATSMEAFLSGKKPEKLKEFPRAITELTQLNQLILKDNELSSIPDEIGQLTDLKRLDLSNNQLTDLPDTLGDCKNLKRLLIKGNKIPAARVAAIQKLLPKTKIIQ